MSTSQLKWKCDSDLQVKRSGDTFANRWYIFYLLTAAPVGADAKHSFPVLDLFHSDPTWEIFGFAPISTAGETPETPQAGPPKLAQVKALPQLEEEDIPNVQCDRAKMGFPR